MFSKSTILVNATIFREYANGHTKKQQVQYAFDVPESSIKDQERLQRAGQTKLLSVIGRDHEVLGTVSYYDNTGRAHIVHFDFRPAKVKRLIPDGYKIMEQKQSGDKLKKGISAVSKAFDKLMGEEQPKKRCRTTQTKNKTRKTKSKPKSTPKKKTASKTRKTKGRK